MDIKLKIALKDIKRKIIQMKKAIPKIVDPAKYGIHSKTHFKAEEFKELTLLRMVDISECAFFLFKHNRIIPALIMTRSAIETLAVIYYFYIELNNVLESKIITESFVNKLDRLILGNNFEKTEDNPFTPIHIMDCIRTLGKAEKGLKESYDFLCEFCHPNEYGMLNGYSTMNKEYIFSELNLTHLSGKYPNLNGVAILNYLLSVYINIYNEMDSMIERLSVLTKK